MSLTTAMRILTLTVVVALGLAACFSPQPPPPCQTVATQSFNGNPPYLARFTFGSESGTCVAGTRLSSMLIGVQDYVPPGSGPATLALRPARLVELSNGGVFKADIDPSNNCQAVLEGEPASTCRTCGPAGGNPCVFVDDPVARTDPSDPKGAKLNAVGDFPRDPTAGVCAAAQPLVAQQTFAAQTLRLVDGGTAELPALPVTFAFDEVKVLATAQTPGTVFTAKLEHTEGTCSRRYDVLAFYPSVACKADPDCDPNTDLDAGRPVGSGINPDFKPVCDATLKFCVPTVDITKPGFPALN
jgi:hypothetical protein